jgi:hypothetical protein
VWRACNEIARFLRTCFGCDDWTALLLKNRHGGKAVQQIGSLSWACSDQVQYWLREHNTRRHDVYASVNAIAIGARSRTRRDVAVVRHVFVDVDQDAQGVLCQLGRRSDLPQPSYVVHTSPERAHVLWRARDFDPDAVERTQKQLAADLGGDLAATSVAQLTRLPGLRNHKYDEPYVVWVDYRDVEHVYTPHDFPYADSAEPDRPEPVGTKGSVLGYRSPAERARAYLSRIPPAVAGHHGDLHTFRTCCRVVRGFALDEDQALVVLVEWNANCQPPWTERELREKIRSARRNGREPIGGLL